MKRKVFMTVLSGMLAASISASAMVLVSALSGPSLVVADDPLYTKTVDLKAEDVSSSFKGVFVGGKGTLTAGDAAQVWDFDAQNGTITSKASLVESEGDVWNDWFYLYYTGEEYKNFYMEVTLQHIGEAAGWSGLTYGVEDVTKPAKGAAENPKGGISFVQGDGKYTWHNNAINSAEWNDTGIVATDFNGLNDTVHHLKVYEGHMQYWLNDEDPIIIDVEAEAAALTSGNVGVAVTNKTVAVKSFKITSLKSDGTAGSDEYVAAEEIAVEGIEDGQTVDIAKAIDVDVSVLPEGASAEYIFTSDNPSAVFEGGKLYFKEAGEYTLTFTAKENADVKTVLKVTAQAPQGYVAYEFTDAAMNRFDPVFIAGGSGNGGTSVAWDEYFEISDGVLSTKGDATGSVGNNYKVLYLKNRDTADFEVIFSAKASGSNGWFGIQFAMKDTTQAGNQNGVFAMMQHSAKKATFWGGPVTGIGGPHEIDSSYVQDTWNLFKVRVLNGTMEFFVNNMASPVLTKTATEEDIAGAIGLFADDGCKVQFKDVYFGYLTEEGALNPYTPVESVTISNKTATATVGDKISLDVTVNPESATDKGITFASENPVVAAINDKGEITCLTAGTTTISVVAVDDSSKTDSFTLTVEKKTINVPVNSVQITNKAATAKVGDELVLQVTVNPSDATNKALSYASTDETIATVSETGKVTFLKEGEVTITVTSQADAGKTDSFTVSVLADTENTDSSAEEGGCSSSVTGVSLAVAGMILGTGAVLVMKKRKETK